MRVQRQFLVGGNALDDLRLVFLSLGAEVGDRVVARHHRTRHRQRFDDNILHLRFDRGEILGGELALEGKIIEKAIVDDRTDRHLRIGKQPLHGLRK